jgi:hypothetical protein
MHVNKKVLACISIPFTIMFHSSAIGFALELTFTRTQKAKEKEKISSCKKKL